MKQLNSSLILIVSAFFLMLGFTMPITVHAAAINAATKTDVTPGTQFTTYKVPVYRLHIANTGDATDTITSLSPTPSGSANDTLVTLRFYLDANNNGFVDQGDTNLGAPAAFASDNTIQTFDITDVTVLAGGSANILITAEGNSVANNTLNFTLSFAAGSGILMTVQPTGTFPLTNANATTFTTTVPSLTIADAANDPAPKSVAAGASNVAVKRLAITAAAGTSDSVVSLAPTPTGTATDNSDITSVVFYIDNGTAGVVDGADIQLSTTPTTYSGDDARTIFTFLSPFQVAAGSTVNILIVYNLDAGVTIGDTLYTEIAAVGDVIAGSGTALNGETSTISSLITIAVVDVIDPTVAITDDEAGTANIAGGDVVFTFTFSETVTGFATGDVVVAGGTKGTFTPVSGTVYTLAVTPNLSSITSITVDVAGDVAFDLASNGNTIATQSVQTVDTVAPTVTVTMSDAVLTFGETSLVTFTFSETPVGFTTADVTVANGSIGAIDASIALVQTATYTPTNGITDATNVISVGTDWTDAASNVGGPDDSPNYTIDTIAPQLIVNKVVINDNGGTKVISNFSLFIDGNSVTSGVASTTTIGLHTVSETSDSGYTTTIGGNCATDGTITLVSGDVKTCTVTNNDIAPGGSGGSVGSYYAPVPPLIDVVKVPSPLALPGGSGLVKYTYTLRNIGTVPVANITMVGDTCSPITLVSGDTNADARLDVNETWIHTCSTTLTKTHTNIVTATGWANGISAVDIASATVVVGVPIIPPLIHVVKKPNLLVVPIGGAVTYTYTVTNPGTAPLSNVSISDDKCTGLPGRVVGHPGDLNKNNLLESNEAWSFTCQSRLFQTTVNTGTAEGTANGLTAKDFALATVVVTIPKLPNTGLPPEEKSAPWNIIIPAGVFITLFSFYLTRKKKAI